MILVEVKYNDGMYYLSTSEIPRKSKEFTEVFKTSAKNVMKLAVKDENAFFAPIGSFNLDDEQIFELKNILYTIPEVLDKDFREIVVNSLDKEIILEDSIIFAVSSGNTRGYFVLNYDRDLEDLISKYADYVCEAIANNKGTVYFDCYQFGKYTVGSFNAENNNAALEELRSNLKTIKESILTKHSENDYPSEHFRGVFSFEEEYGDRTRTKVVYFPLDLSFEETISSYIKEYEATEDIESIAVNNYENSNFRVFTADDGEVFEILRECIANSKLRLNNGYNLDYKYYQYPVENSYSSSLYVSDITYEIYERTFYLTAEITYKNGDREILDIELHQKTYDALSYYGSKK